MLRVYTGVISQPELAVVFKNYCSFESLTAILSPLSKKCDSQIAVDSEPVKIRIQVCVVFYAVMIGLCEIRKVSTELIIKQVGM